MTVICVTKKRAESLKNGGNTMNEKTRIQIEEMKKTDHRC